MTDRVRANRDRPSFENTDPAASSDDERAGHQTEAPSQDVLPSQDAFIEDDPKAQFDSRRVSRATRPTSPQPFPATAVLSAEPVDRTASVTNLPLYTQAESGLEQQNQQLRDALVTDEADGGQHQGKTLRKAADEEGPKSSSSPRPSLQRWTSFTNRHDRLMTSRIASGDVRRVFNERAEQMTEATASLADALLDVESRGALRDIGLSTALTDTLLRTSRELRAAAEELKAADELLVQEEYSLQQIVPRLLGDNSAETLDLLQAQNLDFRDEEIMDAETVSAGDMNRWAVLDTEADNGPSTILRRIEDVENQLLLHEKARDHKEVHESSNESNNGDAVNTSHAKRSQADVQRDLLLGQLSTLRLELEASRGSISVQSDSLAPAQSSSDLRDSQKAALEDMLYLSDTEKKPVFPLRLGSGNVDVGDKSDHTNAWLLHQMQRSRTELTRWSSQLSDGVRDMAGEDVRSLAIGAWFQDQTRTSVHSSVRVEDSNKTSSAPTVPDNHLSAPKQITRPLSPSLERRNSGNESPQGEDSNATLRLHSESMATRRAQ